ncbi:MAG: chaperonin GroEL [Chloroflexi bacterium]|nr:chaperonin GroEL [Chloroflexota bacterium]
MVRQVLFGQEAHAALLRGVDSVADVVRGTLGPRGRWVVMNDEKDHHPILVNDGVTIAKGLDHPDRLYNLGAQILKQASARTNEVAGDGTTTSTVLAQAMVHEGFKLVAAGAEPMALKRGMEKALEAARAQFKRMAKPLETDEEVGFIASLAANDASLGQLIMECVKKVGRDGGIAIEDSNTGSDSFEFTEGMQLGTGSGWISPYFVTDRERLECVIEKCYILITNRRISVVGDLIPTLDKLLQVSKNLLIVCDGLDGEALNTLVVNRIKGNLNVCVVKMPGASERQKSRLEDLAIVTGGRLFTSETGRSLSHVSVQDLGRAQKALVTKDQTTIFQGLGSKEAVEERLNRLKHLVPLANDAIDSLGLKERIAKLSGGIAVLRVGAPTEAALREKKLRVEDALNATRAAIDDGIVPGGGLSYIKAAFAVDRVPAEGDEALGVQIVRKALERPLWQIAENAGLNGNVIVQMVRELAGPVGFDARTQDFVNVYEAGILDPLKVVRSALENAVSVAATLLTAVGAVSIIPGTERMDEEDTDYESPFKKAMGIK